MHILRPILAVLIAVSVAVLPASAGIISAADANETVVSEAVQTASMPVDCEHHKPAQNHGSKTTHDCGSMAGCAVSCFNYVGTTVPVVLPATTSSRLQPIPAADLVVSSRGSPPFRPPRI